MQLGKYEFDGKIVTIYSTDLKAKYAILSENSKEFYIKRNENYFYLYFSKLPLDFVRVNDSELTPLFSFFHGAILANRAPPTFA